MKIRTTFVTNSSSTNFLLMTDGELTKELLFEKLGFEVGSPIEEKGMELCSRIIEGIYCGPRFGDEEEKDSQKIEEEFGSYVLKKHDEYKDKGYYIYFGRTHSGEETLTDLFTMDTFEIEETGFYLNARNCIW